MLSNEQTFSVQLAGGSRSLQLRNTPIYFYVLSWILLLPLLFYATNSSPSVFSDSNSALMSNNASLLKMHDGIRSGVVVQYVFMAILLFTGRVEILRAVQKNKFIVLSGLALAASSSLWSASPVLSLRYTVDLTFTTAFACYLSERFSSEYLMKLILFTGCVAAVLSVGLALFIPDYGIYHRNDSGAWQGLFSHKNALGLGMAGLLTPIFYVRQKLSLRIVYSVALLALVILSQSRSAWFVAAGVLAFVAWQALFRRFRGVESIMLSVVTFATTAAVVGFAVSHLSQFMTWIGKDPSLTGRTDIYRLVFEAILKHPMGGYGYGAFWLGITPESRNIAMLINWPNIGYAENGFLELGLQLGFGGIVIAAVIMGKAFGQGISLLRSPYYTPRVAWFTVLIFLELITNIDAGVVLAPGNMMWTFTLIGALGLANEVKRIADMGACAVDATT